MVDEGKTNFLRQKIQQFKKEDSTVESKNKKDSEAIAIIVFLLRYFSFFGAQHYIILKLSHEPFTLWESLLIYLTLSNFLTIKQRK